MAGAEPLFVSLQTTAALTSNKNDAFNQLLHQLNAVLNVRAANGSPSSEMHRAAMAELHECISRNERRMYGDADAKNIAFLNFAKSFAALSDSTQNLFDPLSPHCATPSEASPHSAPPRLYPANRHDFYHVLHDERDFDQAVDASRDNSSNYDDVGGRRNTTLLSPHYRTSSPMYEYEAKSDADEERDLLEAQRATTDHHDPMISTLFGPVLAASTPKHDVMISTLFGSAVAASTAKAPPAKKQKLTVTKGVPLSSCPYCEFQSMAAHQYTTHVRAHHPSRFIEFTDVGCHKCDYRSNSTNALKNHTRAVHGDAWLQWISQRRISFPTDARCPFCDVEPAVDMPTLCQHVIQQHLNDVNKEDPYIGCDGCYATFNWAADLYAHWTRPRSPCPGYVRLLKLKSSGDKLEMARENTVDEEEHIKPTV